MAKDHNLDLFSLLPEPLLHSITSFFKKDVAKTCILNKKWLNIWQPGNNIDFDENFFVDSTSSDDIKQLQKIVFINFITNWIEHYTNREVNKFSLKISNPHACRDIVERCVSFALQCKAKELALDFSDPKWDENDFDGQHALFELPTHVYHLGSSIQSLKLYSCNFHVSDFNFSLLKDISLGWIELKIKTIQTLLSTCRSIESLSLKNCWNLAHFDLGDKPIGLTKLVVDKCNIDYEYLRFVAPNLKYFKYSGVVFTSDINVTPHVIEEVDIDFALESEFYERGNELCQILQDFFAAKILTVCSYLLQVIPSGDEPMRIQCDLNVRHLILKTQMNPNEYCGYEFLLNSCPSLEKLTFDIDPRVILTDYLPPYDIDLKKYWQGRRVLPQCLKKTLKVIELYGFRATSDELKTCRFLMGAGHVLEEINVNLFNEDGHKEIRRAHAQEYLLNNGAKRVSRNLQININ